MWSGFSYRSLLAARSLFLFWIPLACLSISLPPSLSLVLFPLRFPPLHWLSIFVFSRCLAGSNHAHTAVPVETIVYKEVPVEIIKYEEVEVEVPVEKIVTKEVVSWILQKYKFWLFDALLLYLHQVTLSSTIFLPFHGSIHICVYVWRYVHMQYVFMCVYICY